MTWQFKRLDEIGSLSRGRSRYRPRDATHLYGGAYPFVQTSDVKAAELYLTDFQQTYSEAGLAQSRLWPKGTLCITIAANIAETAILGLEACFPDSIIGFIPDPKQADARFIKYTFDAFLKSQYRAFTQGAAQDNLSQEKLLSLRFPVPVLSMQIRIADILSNYDNSINRNRRRITLLEQAAQVLYREWFVRLRFPGYERTQIVDGVPHGWERTSLAQVCSSIDYGYTASAESDHVGPKLVRITDIVPSYINWASVPYCSIRENRYARFQLCEGDIVIARTGATVGFAKRLNKRHPDAVFASYLVRIRIVSAVDDTLIGVFVESQIYKDYVRSRVGGAAQPNANAKVLTSVKILVPPRQLQLAFREFVEPLFDQAELLQIENLKLQTARDLLLPRLMTGEC